MKHSGRTITLRSLIFLDVFGETHSVPLRAVEVSGKNAAIRAAWLETHGEKVTSLWETWVQKGPDIWLAIQQKK